MDNVKAAKRQWDPEAQLQDLMMELHLDDFDTQAAVARNLREHALVAATSIAHLSSHAGNERVRMQASQYIVDRVLAASLDHDIRLQEAQISVVGQVIASVIRELGLRFSFDPESQEVKQIAHKTMLTLVAADGEGTAA